MRGKTNLLIGIISILPIIWFILSPSTVRAASPSVFNIKISIHLQNNGSAIINEIINYEQPVNLNWPIKFSKISNQKVYADDKPITRRSVNFKNTTNGKYIAVDNIKASTWKISFKTDSAITVFPSEETFHWEVISNLDAYIDSLAIELHSPYSFKEHGGYRVYAFHGVSSHKIVSLDDKNIIFYGEGLGEKSGFTIYASWPSNTYKFNFIKKTLLGFTRMEFTFWLLFGMLLPLVAIVIMLSMILRHKRQSHYHPPVDYINYPPSNLSPTIVGILFDKKIYPHTMLASIIDLCQRGYLVIYKQKNQYAFGRRRQPDDNLKNWEKQLLEELLITNEVWTNASDVQNHAKEQLFNPDIKYIFDQNYDDVVKLDYFVENPHLVRVRYKIIGIIFYLLSILGTGWVVLTMQPDYLLIPLIGMFVTAYVIFQLSLHMPIQSPKGFVTMEQWTRFRNYLKSRVPLGASASVGGLFYAYLPIALSLDVDKEWINRFRNYHLILPDWFMCDSYNMNAEQTIPQLTNMIHKLSRSLSELKGPSVS